MKNKIKSKVIKQKVPLAKSLGELMKDEDGFVSKETILKVGLSTVAALGVVGSMTDITSGQCTGSYLNCSTHTNSIAVHNPNPNASPADTIAANCAQHTNVTTHSSY